MSIAEATNGRAYLGPDRRHHRVFITHHTEYHCRDGVCVAVRSRKTGSFLDGHAAIGRHVDGSLRLAVGGGIESAHSANDAQVGEHLCFSSGDIDDPHNVLTSEVADIERPRKDVVERYPR